MWLLKHHNINNELPNYFILETLTEIPTLKRHRLFFDTVGLIAKSVLIDITRHDLSDTC